MFDNNACVHFDIHTMPIIIELFLLYKVLARITCSRHSSDMICYSGSTPIFLSWCQQVLLYLIYIAAVVAMLAFYDMVFSKT